MIREAERPADEDTPATGPRLKVVRGGSREGSAAADSDEGAAEVDAAAAACVEELEALDAAEDAGGDDGVIDVGAERDESELEPVGDRLHQAGIDTSKVAADRRGARSSEPVPGRSDCGAVRARHGRPAGRIANKVSMMCARRICETLEHPGP